MKISRDAMYYVAENKKRYGDMLLDVWLDIAQRYGLPLDSSQITKLRYCDKQSEFMQKIEPQDAINIFTYGSGELTTEQMDNRKALNDAWNLYKEDSDGNNNND